MQGLTNVQIARLARRPIKRMKLTPYLRDLILESAAIILNDPDIYCESIYDDYQAIKRIATQANLAGVIYALHFCKKQKLDLKTFLNSQFLKEVREDFNILKIIDDTDIFKLLWIDLWPTTWRRQYHACESNQEKAVIIARYTLFWVSRQTILEEN